MKKLILLFALVFSVSTSFISCRDTEKEADDMDDVEMTDDMEEMREDAEDDMEDMADDMEDQVEEMEDEVDDM